MKTKLDGLSSLIVLLLGVVHICATPVLYQSINADSLWFLGSGMSFIFLGFINFSRIGSKMKLITIFCLVANVLTLFFIAALLIVEKSLAIQGFISLGFLIVLTLFSFFGLFKTHSHFFSIAAVKNHKGS